MKATEIKTALFSKSALGIFSICSVVFVLMAAVSWWDLLAPLELFAFDLGVALSHRLKPPEISEKLLIAQWPPLI